jgi:peroxiredoxin/outer membrane lipoprotein-sorting protein
MRLKQLIQVCTSFVLIAGLMVLALRAQDTTQPSAAQPSIAAAHVTADARALLDKIRDSYAKLNTLDVSGAVAIAFDGGGQQRNEHAQFTGAFRSPNKFRHDMKDETTIVSSGDKVYTFLVQKNVYVADAAPKSRSDGLPDQVNALLMDQDPSLAMAMSPDASSLLVNGASDVSMGDPQHVDGTIYPTLKIVQDDEDEAVTIDPKTNLIHSVRHDLSRSVKRQGIPNVKSALVTVDYTPVAADAKPAIVAFDWTPPADAKPYTAPPAAGSGEDPMAPIAAEMDGKPAPAFTLKGLDGKSISLSDLKGSVVVLDFWATWCPPCQEGLPHINKVAKARAADGVKIFAVNQQEDVAQVQHFIQQANLSLPVLLDSDASVSEKYKAESIPETVVIDKNGTVQKVLGLPAYPDEEKALNDQIDAALKVK